MSNVKTIAFVVTAPMTANAFMKDFFKVLAPNYRIYLISNFEGAEVQFDDVTTISIPFRRKVSLISDLKALISLYKTFRKYKFDVVHSITPKAGLLTSIAGFLAGVKKRYHTFTGQVWVHFSKFKKLFFKHIDKLISYLSTKILVDSQSQKDFLVNEGVISESAVVLGNGSFSGVDVQRFQPSQPMRLELRERLGVNPSDFVFLFLGRINSDKGVNDLINAFYMLVENEECKDVKLVIVGPDEELLLNDVAHDSIITIGYTDKPEEFMAMADVFCLPSYREGFGSVIIEAAACKVPSIGSNIYGVSDAIRHDVTGFLHKAGDSEEIVKYMKELYTKPELKNRLGASAYKRAVEKFSKDILSDELLKFYEGELKDEEII